MFFILVNRVQAFNNTCLKYALSLLTSTLRYRYSIATVFILRCKGIDKAFILRSKDMDSVLIMYRKAMITVCSMRAGRRSKIRLLLVILFFIPPGVPFVSDYGNNGKSFKHRPLQSSLQNRIFAPGGCPRTIIKSASNKLRFHLIGSITI